MSDHGENWHSVESNIAHAESAVVIDLQSSKTTLWGGKVLENPGTESAFHDICFHDSGRVYVYPKKSLLFQWGPSDHRLNSKLRSIPNFM